MYIESCERTIERERERESERVKTRFDFMDSELSHSGVVESRWVPVSFLLSFIFFYSFFF